MNLSGNHLLKSLFTFVFILISIISCAKKDSTSIYANPTVRYKTYSRTFLADTYPKSIIDHTRETNKMDPDLSDREVAIVINCESNLDELINYIMRYELYQNKDKISSASFEQAKIKMQAYHTAQKMDRVDGYIINRTQQWFADSIIQSKYQGRIYYDEHEMILKPKEAYLRMLNELIGKNEIVITDDFMKKQMINMLSDEITNFPSITCDFYKIETWPVKSK